VLRCLLQRALNRRQILPLVFSLFQKFLFLFLNLHLKHPFQQPSRLNIAHLSCINYFAQRLSSTLLNGSVHVTDKLGGLKHGWITDRKCSESSLLLKLFSVFFLFSLTVILVKIVSVDDVLFLGCTIQSIQIPNLLLREHIEHFVRFQVGFRGLALIQQRFLGRLRCLGCNAERRRYFSFEILEFPSYVHRWLFVHVVSLDGSDRVDVLLIRRRVKVVILIRI
jgi:hypothetical protein